MYLILFYFLLANNFASASLRLVNPLNTLPPALFHFKNSLGIDVSQGLALSFLSNVV